ncbi:hypothetical protein Psuf_001040 [Phytohabitans suffuscus]|uniref:Transposase IS4-like domain-containing protein n=1 Tax=Phytohabitans suffuscus TaxID=624315 RepID=A0A6F8YA11_9ACTN|nr:hypothetical protein Psuf_001040 [Phytohabitans suffuscus]
MDGTLVPTRDHRLAAPSKNYRYSANLQLAIDANTRPVVALGNPQPGNRNDTIVYRTSGINQNPPAASRCRRRPPQQPRSDHPAPQTP